MVARTHATTRGLASLHQRKPKPHKNVPNEVMEKVTPLFQRFFSYKYIEREPFIQATGEYKHITLKKLNLYRTFLPEPIGWCYARRIMSGD